MARMLCPDCRKPARIVRSEEANSRALLFCEDEACGWEAFVRTLPVETDIRVDPTAYDAAAARQQPRYRRRGV